MYLVSTLLSEHYKSCAFKAVIQQCKIPVLSLSRRSISQAGGGSTAAAEAPSNVPVHVKPHLLKR